MPIWIIILKLINYFRYMIDNVKIFDLSIKNKEPIIDKFYVKNSDLLISDNPKKPSELSLKNNELIESISAYSFAKRNRNKKLMEEIVVKISEILKNKNINYSEFVSFWSVVDISYSLFNKLSFDDKKEVLREIIEKYLELRHNIYQLYGYSQTTIQVDKDAKAHKESGSLANKKIYHILSKYNFNLSNTDSLDDFLKKDLVYIESDKKGKKLFKSIISFLNLKFKWSSGKEEKMPDFLLKYKNNIFIIEHKHMKEGGGGQNKQINEIISLISFTEKNFKKYKIHYVAFLDGIYFNLLSNEIKSKSGKIFYQIKNIKENLKNNKNNYFVNTFGFEQLIKSLK